MHPDQQEITHHPVAISLLEDRETKDGLNVLIWNLGVGPKKKCLLHSNLQKKICRSFRDVGGLDTPLPNLQRSTHHRDLPVARSLQGQ